MSTSTPAMSPFVVRVTVAVRGVVSTREFRVSPEDLRAPLRDFRDRVCGALGASAETHFLFCEGGCMDHSLSIKQQPCWKGDATEARNEKNKEEVEGSKESVVGMIVDLRMSTLRLRHANPTLRDGRIFCDLSPSRPLEDLKQQVRRFTGFYLTPITLRCKGTELVGETIGDTSLHNDDIVQVVRSSDSIATKATAANGGEAADRAEGAAEGTNEKGEEKEVVLHAVSYGNRFAITTRDTHTIADLKKRAVACLRDKVPAISTTELRVVQCGTMFDDTTTVMALQPVPVEILFQWDKQHIADSAKFHKHGELNFNCPFCSSAGGRLQLRPMCSNCTSESIQLRHPDRSDKAWTPNAWADLPNSKLFCNACVQTTNIYWGFFCQSLCCDRRCSTHPNRDMIAVYDSAYAPDMLLKAINTCLSFSCVQVDASAVDQYVQVSVKEKAGDIPSNLNLSDIVNPVLPHAEEKISDTSTTAAPKEAEQTKVDAEPDAEASAKEEDGNPIGAELLQVDLLRRNVHLPDTFFTIDPDSEKVYQWFGMSQGHDISIVGTAELESLDVDAIIALPYYGSADSDATRFVLIPKGPDTSSSASDSNKSIWKKIWDAKINLPFGYSYNFATGGFNEQNSERVKKHASVVFTGFKHATDRIALKISPLVKTQFENVALAVEALSNKQDVDAFCQSFTSADERYQCQTASKADGADGSGGSKAE